MEWNILLNHYASITFRADFVLPFVQFFKECEGNLSESERWLYELGELVKRDKSCFALILRDRQAGKQVGREFPEPGAGGDKKRRSGPETGKPAWRH